MNAEEIYKHAYIKKPLSELYSNPFSVPEEFLLEWFKDAYDYQRSHSDEELAQFIRLKPEEVLTWLEEASVFAWEAKRAWLKKYRKTLPAKFSKRRRP